VTLPVLGRKCPEGTQTIRCRPKKAPEGGDLLKIKQVRRAVRDLLNVPIDRSEPHAMVVSAQDTLEFAAMLVGMKPVFLLGRGFDDKAWISAVSKSASEMRVGLVEDSFWNPDFSRSNIPAWLRDLRRSTVPERAIYISGLHDVFREIREISGRGGVTPDEESRLLGYPRCCVQDHHSRSFVVEETFAQAVMRVAEGDEKEARRIVLDDVKFLLNDEEEARMKWATQLRPCPFTSVYMCDQCAASDRSPARSLSRQYAKLARDLDSELFATLERVSRSQGS
jgi:hypothetical protein